MADKREDTSEAHARYYLGLAEQELKAAMETAYDHMRAEHIRLAEGWLALAKQAERIST